MRELTVFTTTILEVVNFLEYPQVLNVFVIMVHTRNMSARVWNALSNKIDSNTSRTVFKDKLKLFLLNNELVLSYPK